jgi:hypothetical protein
LEIFNNVTRIEIICQCISIKCFTISPFLAYLLSKLKQLLSVFLDSSFVMFTCLFLLKNYTFCQHWVNSSSYDNIFWFVSLNQMCLCLLLRFNLLIWIKYSYFFVIQMHNHRETVIKKEQNNLNNITYFICIFLFKTKFFSGEPFTYAPTNSLRLTFCHFKT